ncbi:MAG: glutathione S-transferase family protein [Rhodospirillales bacterium]|nr:glutathione S-transferase family protein [Rhodospirillales bacterium]
MKLFDLKAGMNPRRVRIFLAEKGIDIPRVEVDMKAGENRKQDFLAINPMGTMPVLELDDGTHLAESISICRYFEELYPDPPLFGTSALERAHIDMWTRRMEFEIARPIVEAFTRTSPFWTGRRHQMPAAAELAREMANTTMSWLDGELSRRPFIAGDSYTIADIVAQCAFVLGKNTGTPIPSECWNLQRWYQDVTRRPSARA